MQTPEHTHWANEAHLVSLGAEPLLPVHRLHLGQAPPVWVDNGGPIDVTVSEQADAWNRIARNYDPAESSRNALEQYADRYGLAAFMERWWALAESYRYLRRKGGKIG